MTINAFHPDYAKTYEKKLLQELRTNNLNKQRGQTLTEHVEHVRANHNPAHGTVYGITKPNLEPKTFHVYAKARSSK